MGNECVGDAWTWQLPSGETKKYTVLKFDKFKDKDKERPSVIIRDTVPAPSAIGADVEIVTTHTYAKGIGEVARSINLEKKGGGKSLVGEMKLVDE